MKWVTRENAKVDRIACPWLIRRFIDEDAEFLYVPADEMPAVAEREGAIPYDVSGVELGHVDGRCSFESIPLEYGLMGDPALSGPRPPRRSGGRQSQGQHLLRHCILCHAYLRGNLT